ncbi:MAG: hypothetical protein IKM87_08050 [Clostridia bacterium]|nr:hypothetical protein [Clostridia bacterium]
MYLLKLMIIIAKSAIKTTLNMYMPDILIAVFVVVEIATCSLVLWETFTGKNIVDVIAGWFEK